jgi:molecular chaperone HtpG
MRETVQSVARDLTLLTIPAVEGGEAAKGWILHHDYLGAIPRELGVRGLRLRKGDIQVGDEATLSDLFAEPRFNSWAVGEIHIVDRRIVPNGRRDHFEQSVHLANVLNHLAPAVRDIAVRCRGQSQYRQRLRNADLFQDRIESGLAVLRQGAISATARRVLVANLELTLQKFSRVCESPMLSEPDRKVLRGRYGLLRRRLQRAAVAPKAAAKLTRLTPYKRRAYEEVFALVFDCASDMRGAKELVDRVLSRLSARGTPPPQRPSPRG